MVLSFESIYLFILQHPLTSIMCSCVVSARIQDCSRFKSAIVRLDFKRHSVSEEEVKLKEVKNSV